jgi:maltooligosyltrehalose trehalohydrolase
MGPEGNYLADFGPYFTNQYHTFWGDAINFDDQYSDPVRQYFIQNALYWLGTYHFDGLRLDAVHAIYDYGAKHVLKEMAEEVAKLSYNLGQKKYLIAESGLNDSKIIRPFDDGGYGLDGQWSDDFHHALHALLTGEKEGYYLDFGEKAHLEKAFQKAFVYTWQYSPFRKKHFGNETEGTHPIQYLAYIQNHDQTGNRLFGERISSLVSYEALKLAAATVILSPYLPMIFMGEEYGEDQPFQYFIHHGDKKLVQAVREGRKNEFKDFDWKEEPPDPQSIETFNRSKLQWDKLPKDGHHQLYQLYKHLIRLRKEHFPGKGTEFNMVSSITAKPGEKILVLKRECKTEAFLYFIGLNDVHLTFEINKPAGRWEKLLDTAEEQWKGEGASMPGIIENDEKLSIQQYNFAIYKKET